MTRLPCIEYPVPPRQPSSDDDLTLGTENRSPGHPVPQPVEHPLRRTLLQQGPPLRDIEAAVRCVCSCHPRPATTTLHNGGPECPCQRTDTERRQALDELLASCAALAPGPEELADRAQRIAAVQQETLVELDEIGGAAPFIIRGRVDGRAFVFRERHDQWTVRIAGDAEPLRCPWARGSGHPTILIAEGDSEDLHHDGTFDETLGIRIATDAVRTFLHRRACPHRNAGRYCPDCGVEIRQADRWRIDTRDAHI